MNLLLPIILILPVIVSSQLACPPNYTLVIDKCLMIIKTPLTHSQAEIDCTYNGGTLANIDSAIINRAVTQFASNAGINKTWIGLFCFENRNTSMCYYDDASGTLMDYNSFASGYPMVDGIYGGCVYMPTTGSLTGKWVSVKCEAESIPAICQMPVTSYDPTCVHNFNGYCYTLSSQFSNLSANFADARKICQDNNSDLVTIHSKREVDYIKSLYRGTIDPVDILIGAQQTLPNIYTWVDGFPWEKFDYRDPMDRGAQDIDCLTMNSVTGLWTRAVCDRPLLFVCKRYITGNPSQAEVAPTENPSDFSNCNTTFLMTPGTITSYGYLSTSPPEVNCTWRIVTLGPYRVRLFFTDVDTYNTIYVYNEYGIQIEAVRYSRSVISRSNIVTVSLQGSGESGYRGFRAVALTY
ncbi:hypothetical protein GCK72_007115 [Caenorhabditis remanei]|uniref:C-type lectin domain-containing protein n=1 Tax=Caenorhabditis remanei TaxID=31234 RepID=A0A6A5HKD9_CAERE|nr:hypothetical protein GCK72_007115 [Caenorhabditis remanei]KAF1767156.1 hypothetical protein GCK72_007115 [Caenorhabditis remanei]